MNSLLMAIVASISLAVGTSGHPCPLLTHRHAGRSSWGIGSRRSEESGCGALDVPSIWESGAPEDPASPADGVAGMASSL